MSESPVQQDRPDDLGDLALGPAGRIARFFIDSKLTPLLVLAALAVGLLAVALTPREEEPQIVLPVVDIFVGLPGASPSEVEKRVTLPLEKKMWEIPGVEYVYSTSMPDQSMVTVRFLVGHDHEDAMARVFEKIAGGLDLMPPDATVPLIKVRTIDDVPILGLTLSSDRYDAYELRRLAAELRREIQGLDDVSDIDLIGGQRRQVRVRLDAQRMAVADVDPASLVQALQLQSASAPAGSYQEENREILVETGGFLRSAEEVAETVVGVEQDPRTGARAPVYLRDVAEVSDEPEEARDYVFFRSAEQRAGSDLLQSAVTISIAKRKGSDANRVAESILERVEELRPHLLPPEVELTVTRDYGETANEKAQELLLHLVVAIVSVSVLIGLFLGWRGALVVFISVPVSFALTLFVYYLFGYTLNRVTLFALIFVTGIVVDDSIIVVENIVRHLAQKKPGVSALRASIEAVDEVGNPTILATLTVIASVAPMAFVRGLMGPYMLPMPTGASLAMGFSLLVALMAAPWFAYRLLKSSDVASEHDPSDRVILQSRVYRTYERTLVPLLVRPRRAWLFLGVIFGLLLLAIALVPLQLVNVKMLPFDNKSEFQVVIDMPEGTTLEETSEVARRMSDYLVTVPEVTDVQLYVGTASPISFNGLVRHYDLRSGPHVGDIQVNLRSKDERDRQSHDIAQAVRPRIQEIAAELGAAAKVVEVPPGPPVLSTLVAEVYGPSEEERQRVAAQILEVFDSTEGVVDTDWFVEAPQAKQIFRVDREKAALHGVPASQVSRALRLVLEGESAGRIRDGRELEPVEIVLELPRSERSSVRALGEVRLASMTGDMVPLSELVEVEETVREPSRYRKNLQPLVYVVGEVAGGSESPVYAILEMAEKIDRIELPAGGTVEQYYRDEPVETESAKMKWDGEWHITYEVFRDLGAAFGAALILIYILIIGWFGSFKVPLVMMIAIPLGLVGVLPGHWLFGAFFTATSMIGFIALAGIMVRNSVLLIDFVNLALREGKTLGEAVVEAGAVRLRPILLTAGTVVVGAFVILFDPIFQGLAIALMTGAIASTALTLVVVPLVYFMTERRRYEQPVPAGWLRKERR